MITTILIVITSIVSYMAFTNEHLMQRFIFYPPAIQSKQWYRFITYGFLHADLSHLIFNMLALYLFGSEIEKVFAEVFGVEMGAVLYLLLYFTSLAVSIVPTWINEKNNPYYRSLGASGAVSSVVFAYILVYPMNFMGLMFIPIMLPAFIFGVIYIVASAYLDKKQAGNINHSAHIAGGVYGVVFMSVVFQLVANINILLHFISSIQIFSWKDLIHVGY